MTKENNGWFSVKNKLPELYPHQWYGEKSDALLLYGSYDCDASNISHIFIGFMIRGNIFYSDDYGECEIGYTTHWRYLPLPPTETNN